MDVNKDILKLFNNWTTSLGSTHSGHAATLTLAQVLKESLKDIKDQVHGCDCSLDLIYGAVDEIAKLKKVEHD
jgi:hypothetical protein